MSLEPYGPRRPDLFSKPVGNVAQALDDLAELVDAAGGGGGGIAQVDGYSTAGQIVVTGSSDTELDASGASADDTGAISSQGHDISTGGGNLVTGPGLVDGRDVSVDGTKLDTIETNADVTDATNVDAAGAVMQSDITGTGIVSWAFGAGTGRTITGGTGITVTNGNGVGASPVIAVDGTVLTDSDFGSNGGMHRTSAGVYTTRTLTAGDGIVVANGDGVAGNPTATVDLSTDASMEFATGDLQLENDAASPGKEKYYGTDSGAGAKGWHALPAIPTIPGQIISMLWGSNSSASNAIFGRCGVASTAGSGVGGYSQRHVPRDCTLVRIQVSMEVTAWTSGVARVKMFKNGSGTPVYNVALAGPSGTGVYRQTFDVTPGTMDWAEDDYIAVAYDMNDSGVMTTRDQVWVMYFQLDDEWVPA